MVAGRTDARSLLKDFISNFEGRLGNRDGEVTVQEWLGYYEDISASIDSDDHFSLMMAKTWGHLKTPGKTTKPAVSHVSAHQVRASS